ncbi:nucleotidyltransferase domain-containing protein [Photobacterium sp. TY1-4]|uniref:nucleotidyltransferase domain-containing protein n=1 Tax=Photobacterium sp. TY1-4 TaxID=2899122 RepID=UPI0021BFB445|nr:nucleotidyltransferase domain-containing protein [Photobacterium sp. TY1-4]UXI02377.1 nucleotidyltransferase domain-containing protein [Photobacterium sp. TY1-4]
MKHQDPLIEALVRALQAQYQPHTIIFYGSRARGDATATSDIDVACFVDDHPELKDARLFQGVYLDNWVYPTQAMQHISKDTLRFADGACLVDQRGLGEEFLTKVRKKFAAGPERLSDSDRAHTTEWISKMLQRIETEDVEGMYRRCWLQLELLEVYFHLRDQWFLGPKKSFQLLKDKNPVGYQLFFNSYQAPTDLKKLQLLANHVSTIASFYLEGIGNERARE